MAMHRRTKKRIAQLTAEERTAIVRGEVGTRFLAEKFSLSWDSALSLACWISQIENAKSKR